MSKYSTIIGLGILVAITPFLGFPIFYKDIFFITLGLVIAVIAYFSNIQYCNNCNRLVENGKHGVGGNKQPTVGGEVSNPSAQGGIVSTHLPERERSQKGINLPGGRHATSPERERRQPSMRGQSEKNNTGIST